MSQLNQALPSNILEAASTPTAPRIDLRIVAFMCVVALFQLLTFKRPFS
jgi:hypothetical protein